LVRALRLAALLAAATVALAAPAVVLAHGDGASSEQTSAGEHDSSGGGHSDQGAGSGKGGGLGSTLKSTLCGAVGSVPVVGGALQGLLSNNVCDSGGGESPVAATRGVLLATFAGVGAAAALVYATIAREPRFASAAGVLERPLSACALALLALALTFAGLRLAAGGLLEGGGDAGAAGIARTATAAGAIIAWPWGYQAAVVLLDSITHWVLGLPVVRDALYAHGGGLVAGATAAALAGKMFSPRIAWALGILIFGALAVEVVGLLALKVVVVICAGLVFVAMPLALAAWPTLELSWLAGLLGRLLLFSLAAPVIWALVLGLGGVMGAAAVGGLADLHGGVLGVLGGLAAHAIIEPLAMVALFGVALVTPFALLRAHPLVASARAGARRLPAAGRRREDSAGQAAAHSSERRSRSQPASQAARRSRHTRADTQPQTTVIDAQPAARRSATGATDRAGAQAASPPATSAPAGVGEGSPPGRRAPEPPAGTQPPASGGRAPASANATPAGAGGTPAARSAPRAPSTPPEQPQTAPLIAASAPARGAAHATSSPAPPAATSAAGGAPVGAPESPPRVNGALWPAADPWAALFASTPAPPVPAPSAPPARHAPPAGSEPAAARREPGGGR
jgi:hypothetical protein